MRFNILSDSDWEAKIDKVTDYLLDSGYRRFFEDKNYGNSLDGITIVLMCTGHEQNLKQRIRYSRKEKKVYMDIMLDLNQFKRIDQQERTQIVVDKLLNEVIPIIKKYKFEDFDKPKFEDDFNKFFIKCAKELEKLANTLKKP